MAHHLKRIIRSKVIFGLIVLSIFTVTLVGAETGKGIDKKEILVVGTGNIAGGNIARAREAAISDALIRGVEEYLSRRLGSQGMMNNFPRLIRDVIPKAREEIENFYILTGERTDKHYKVLVRLKINEKVIEEKFREIGLVLTGGPPIKVLFLVSQIEKPVGEISYWWRDPEGYAALTPTEVVLHRAFEERGFSPVNRLLRVPEEKYSSEMRALDLSNEDATRWGQAFSAQVVIHGGCEIVEGKEVSVRLTALDVDRAFMIEQDYQIESLDQGAGRSEQIMQSMERAMNRIASRLSPLIIRAIRAPEVKTSRLEIVLKGLRSFRDFRMLRDFLERDVEGVESVRQTRVRGNIISIMVEFSGDEDKFLDIVLRHENLPFQVDAIKTDEGEIVFNIR
ncbi:MAG: hypothetical protein PVG99_12455 [Desulfobacteraceae bacterium]